MDFMPGISVPAALFLSSLYQSDFLYNGREIEYSSTFLSIQSRKIPWYMRVSFPTLSSLFIYKFFIFNPSGKHFCFISKWWETRNNWKLGFPYRLVIMERSKLLNKKVSEAGFYAQDSEFRLQYSKCYEILLKHFFPQIF